MNPSPRPILKRSSSPCRENDSELPFYGIQAVHFPPSPSISRFYNAYSSTIYDRSPIVVSPNSCALPERGCPGRTYTLDERSLSAPPAPLNLRAAHRGGHLHPNALSQRHPQIPHSNLPHCPPLIPDLSSESDESDGFNSPPPEAYYAPRSYSHRTDKFPSLSLDNTAYFATKLDSCVSPSPTECRRKSRREREQFPTVVDDVAADDPGYDDDHDTPTPSSRSLSSKKGRCRKSLSRVKVGFNDAEDAGCLDGF